ncbi:MAG: hypothetical protein NT167_10460, partial [Verrucomicrobia bacterium]|nr:hypothetical protein [Verrucomicrobiota bacterium]
RQRNRQILFQPPRCPDFNFTREHEFVAFGPEPVCQLDPDFRLACKSVLDSDTTATAVDLHRLVQ